LVGDNSHKKEGCFCLISLFVISFTPYLIALS
jgi:hypothetical protein